MNSTKKNYLKVATILIIVFSSISIAMGLLCVIAGGAINEEFIKDTYRIDEEYTYHENADGSYYFTYNDDGEVLTVKESEIELEAKVTKIFTISSGILVLGIQIPKLILSILALKAAKKNKFKKGLVIALIVLSAINTQVLELVFLILALCAKDNPPITYESLGDLDEETMAN